MSAARDDDAMQPPITARDASRKRAGRDILVQLVVRVVNLALGVFVTALLVRTLGTAHYGEWSTIFVIVTLVGFFADFGLEQVAVRHAAREPEHQLDWLAALMVLRLVAVGPVMLVALAAILLVHDSNEMLVAGLIIGATMPFSGVGALRLIFSLRIDNRVPMLVLTLRSVLWAAAVVAIHWRHGSMIELAIAISATNATGSIVETVAALRLAGRLPRPSRERVHTLIRQALPVGISGMLVVGYARIDQLVVFELAGKSAAGLYGSVYTLLDQSQFIPMSILTTLSPIIAAAWPIDRPRMLRAVRTTAELLSIASFGGLAFAIVAGGPVVRLIFGDERAAAAPALPVFAAAFVFIGFGYLIDSVLVTLGLQRRMLWVSMLALAVNLIGNLILVPAVGFMGAAWMTLATEVIVFTLNGRLVLRELQLSRPPLGRLGRIALAAVLLGCALGATRILGAPLAALIALTAVGYPALLLGLRAVVLADLHVILRGGT